jgi:hypothetical protein
MTLVHERVLDGPQVHALVIGVDRYPHCGSAAARQTVFRDLARRIETVSCAGPSAQAVARWLVEHQSRDRHAPLGSVELLVSSDGLDRFDTPEGSAALESATFDRIRDAFDRWYERCDRSEEAIAWFYFCGHGLRIGDEDILLTEDLGAAPQRFFDNAIALGATLRAFQHCRAGVQCFFVDACREVPEEMVAARDIPARPLRTALETARRPPVRDTPIIHASAPGFTADAPAGRPTPFATALLQAMDGLAAEPGRPWEVRTSGLGAAVAKLVRWNAWPGAPGQTVTTSGVVRDSLLRVLDESPAVPFRLGLTPLDALAKAHLRLAHPRRPVELARAPAAERWCGEAPANTYEMTATFAGGEHADGGEEVFVMPPHSAFDLPVGPS